MFRGQSRIELIIIFIGLVVFGISLKPALSEVPKDQLPVPWEQINFEGCNPSQFYSPATRTMSEVYISEDPHGSICWDADINNWYSPDGNVNSNIHVIIKFNGEWYATPWDYMGWGNIKSGTDTVYCKGAEHLGDIPESQHPESMGWKPTPGEEIYHFASTICRDPSGPGVQERTNVVKCNWATGISCFPPAVCTGEEEAPRLYSFTSEPEKVTLIPNKEDNNVLLSWDTDFADNLRLVSSTGESAETNEYSPALDGVWVRIDKETTFTLTAMNDCTPESEWPSMSVTVDTQGLYPTGAVTLLLLNDYANATTL